MIETVSETASTNADLLGRLRRGETLPEGAWLRAERQTAGRGRLGREWQSLAGNLHCSTVVRLKRGDPAATTLSFLTGLAVFDTVEHHLPPGAGIMLKWPNDTLVQGAKIAGILLERQGDVAVAGIGINIAHAPAIDGRQTTSLATEQSRPVASAPKVLDTLAARFAARLDDWRNRPLGHTLAEWTLRSHRWGDRLRVTDSNERAVQGHYRGITAEGALRLTGEGKAEDTILTGDVDLGWDDRAEGKG